MNTQRSVSQLQGRKCGIFSKGLRSKKYCGLSVQKRRKLDICSPVFATKRTGSTKRNDDDDDGIGTAENPAIPGFGRQDDSVNLAKRGKPEEYLATKDVFQSPFKDKGVLDSSGAEGKGIGVYRYTNKYKGNIDTYSPIYSPEQFGDDAITAMTNTQFILFMIPFTIAFAAIPGLIFVKGYGII